MGTLSRQKMGTLPRKQLVIENVKNVQSTTKAPLCGRNRHQSDAESLGSRMETGATGAAGSLPFLAATEFLNKARATVGSEGDEGDTFESVSSFG